MLTAAQQRIAYAFDHFERICVSFSGGKDSTVMLHLTMAEAHTRGRRVGVLFVDLEGQYRLTIEHIGRCLDLYADMIEPIWVALPLNLRNAVSQYEPQWMCWDPDRQDDWIRPMPDRAISDEAAFPFFRQRMEFEEFIPEFMRWYAGGRPTASLVGIRSDESLNRWRAIAKDRSSRYCALPWTTRNGEHVVSAYPIYDWRTEDIWTYHARFPDHPYNGLYDLMHRAGLSIHQQRICQPYGNDQRKGLWLFQVIEPETWARVVARVNGANQGSLYARNTGNILGVGKITCPEGHTWQSFADMLLDSMPDHVAEHYRNKIAVFIRWWNMRGIGGGLRGFIPDEADPKEEAARRVPSWRRICKSLLRNDYWCKGLSFEQQKTGGDSYARYQAIMRRRREKWGIMPPGQGGPTEKQLAMLAALIGRSRIEDGFKAIARALGRQQHGGYEFSRAEASRAIDIIIGTPAHERAGKYGV